MKQTSTNCCINKPLHVCSRLLAANFIVYTMSEVYFYHHVNVLVYTRGWVHKKTILVKRDAIGKFIHVIHFRPWPTHDFKFLLWDFYRTDRITSKELWISARKISVWLSFSKDSCTRIDNSIKLDSTLLPGKKSCCLGDISGRTRGG